MVFKIITKIKQWYRGKQVPPRTILFNGEHVTVQRDKYIPSPSVRFIQKARTFLAEFWLRSWGWIITITLALAMLIVALMTYFASPSFKEKIP
jgi:hypothetical protein